jgi:hypothetical protein
LVTGGREGGREGGMSLMCVCVCVCVCDPLASRPSQPPPIPPFLVESKSGTCPHTYTHTHSQQASPLFIPRQALLALPLPHTVLNMSQHAKTFNITSSLPPSLPPSWPAYQWGSPEADHVLVLAAHTLTPSACTCCVFCV